MKKRQLEKDTLRMAYVVWILFFLSGLCGLIYEVIWMHDFGLIMGNTVYSLSTVLTALMSGLALGSHLSGKFTSRFSRLLRLYGILEILIGLYCLSLPLAFDMINGLNKSIHDSFGHSFFLLTISRFLLSFILILIPTTCMGATLPVLSEAFVRAKAKFGHTVGSLYALNALGAAVGSLLTAFLLIPRVGIFRTVVVAALTNITLGIVAISLDRRFRSAKRRTAKEEVGKSSGPLSVGNSVVALAVFTVAVSGCSAMISQVGWIRVLSLAIGSTIYAVSVIIAVFILGLAIGSAVFGRLADRWRDLVIALAFVEVGIGVTCGILVPILGVSPQLFIGLILKYAQSFDALLTAELSLIAALILLPTFLMGAVFPLVARIYAGHVDDAGRSVGRVYAVNTIGAILGSFSAGFILIPTLGIKYTLAIAAILPVVAGLLLYLVSSSRRSSWVGYAFTSIVVAGIFITVLCFRLLDAWNPKVLASGNYMLSNLGDLQEAVERDWLGEYFRNESAEILFYEEGVTGTIAVIEDKGYRFLKLGGKTDATNFGDMPTQLLLAHVPMLLHPNPNDVLVIGLGSGVTVGSALTYEELEKVDVLEISPEIVEAVRDKKLFDDVNNRPFDDPNGRVELVVTDARNHAALTPERYDVIISEPSNPWLAGMAMLFTQEHFENCERILNPGGIMCQWLPAYRIGKEDFLSVLATFASVFNYVAIWEPIPGTDYLFVGSDQPIVLNYELVTERLKNSAIGQDLARLLIFDVPQFLAYHVSNNEQTRALIKGARINTDDNVALEYSAPRHLFQHGARELPFNQLRLHSQPPVANVNLDGAERDSLKVGIKRIREGRQWLFEAALNRWKGQRKEALQALASALQRMPVDWNARNLENELRLEAARSSLEAGRFEQALNRLGKVTPLPQQPVNQLNEYRAFAFNGVGKELMKSGKVEEAIQMFGNAVELEPENEEYRKDFAEVLLKKE